MNIIITPFNVSSNQYINITKNAFLSLGYNVSSIRLSLIVSRKNNIFICNWIEDHIAGRGLKPIKGFLHAIMIIAFGKIAAKKFIWIRHNLKPHYGSDKNKLYSLIIKLLSKLCDEKCSHAMYMHGYSYIPHPLYNLFQSPQIEPYRSKEFVYFGHINRYKGLVELLTVWPAGIKIEIHGKCSDPKLLAEIIDIISSRKLQVTTDFSFISEEQLKELLIQTKYIVLPHAADSMIVSGAFYHSISYGANILIKKSKFGNEVASRHNFCTTFDYDNLASVLTEQKYIPANNVLNEAINNYGFDVFKRSWLTLL